MPISVLNRGGETHDPIYEGDPLLGARIEIDPLVFAFETAGRLLFAGGKVRLTDGTKVAVGSGEAPAAQPADQRPQNQSGGRRQRGGSSARPNAQK